MGSFGRTKLIGNWDTRATPSAAGEKIFSEDSILKTGLE